MTLGETARRRLVVLLSAAIALLLGRIVAGGLGVGPTIEQVLYMLAVGCLVAGVVVVFVDHR